MLKWLGKKQKLDYLEIYQIYGILSKIGCFGDFLGGSGMGVCVFFHIDTFVLFKLNYNISITGKWLFVEIPIDLKIHIMFLCFSTNIK